MDGNLLLIGLAGFSASLVDGALGMGFGPTSSTILLSTGLSPAGISTTVNLAKVASGLVAAVSHFRFGNIDKRIVVRLALPGAVGALIGVTVLANVDGKTLKPILAVLLVLVGARILVRFARMAPRKGSDDLATVPTDLRGITAAATTGGITNGLIGAWGPVVTPFLLHKEVPPRYAIGSVNTAEVAVAVVASGSLLGSLGGGGIEVSTVVAMLVGGALAAPIAAWSIRHIPQRGMGVAVAGLLLGTNVRELATAADLGPERWAAYVSVAAACAIGGAWTRIQAARARSLGPAPADAPA